MRRVSLCVIIILHKYFVTTGGVTQCESGGCQDSLLHSLLPNDDHEEVQDGRLTVDTVGNSPLIS